MRIWFVLFVSMSIRISNRIPKEPTNTHICNIHRKIHPLTSSLTNLVRRCERPKLGTMFLLMVIKLTHTHHTNFYDPCSEVKLKRWKRHRYRRFFCLQFVLYRPTYANICLKTLIREDFIT